MFCLSTVVILIQALLNWSRLIICKRPLTLGFRWIKYGVLVLTVQCLSFYGILSMYTCRWFRIYIAFNISDNAIQMMGYSYCTALWHTCTWVTALRSILTCSLRNLALHIPRLLPLIWWPVVELQRGGVSMKFESPEKFRCWNEPLLHGFRHDNILIAFSNNCTDTVFSFSIWMPKSWGKDYYFISLYGF